jgi:hypothetical protein
MFTAMLHPDQSALLGTGLVLAAWVTALLLFAHSYL